MTDKETLKPALDDLMVEYDMERTSFAKRVDEIFKQATPEQPSPVTSLQARALDKKAKNARELGLDYEPALDRTGMTYYKNDECKALDSASHDCICWTPAAPALQAELDATNRQVEILSDALAESRREVAALKAVQEPVAWMVYTQDGQSVYVTDNSTDIQESQRALPLYTTPPAARRQWTGLTDAEIDELSRTMVKGNKSVNWLSFSIEARLKENNDV